ncbi:transglutaminase family protein [Rhodobacteraceae bacterium CCMM004]|nr:transglutaminase family protein [Rhodobacteraceae bacterium CCMM004]
MRLRVDHATTYRYAPAKRGVVQSLRLWPSQFAGQDVRFWDVAVEGPDAIRGTGFRDGAGDWIETASLRGAVDTVTVRVSGEVETRDTSGVVLGLKERVPPQAYLRPTRMTRREGAIVDLAAEATADATTPLDRAHALARAVTEAVVYRAGVTASDTTAAEALALGEGVCQDQAHVLIAAAQSTGTPARYVTGYLHADSDGQFHEASHAWAELWVEGLGWVGFDPANGCCPNELYIRIGSGHDAVAAAPIRGVSAGGGDENMEVAVTVMESAQ